MIDPEDISRRLEEARKLLDEMEDDEEPDVEAAAEVARIMGGLAEELRRAVRSAMQEGPGLPDRGGSMRPLQPPAEERGRRDQ